MNTASAQHPSTRKRLAQAVSLVTVALLAGGVVSVNAASSAQAVEDDSSVTVKWAGGNSADLQQYQVDHAGRLSDATGNDAGSGHWDDFKNLQITVSQTAGLSDGAITVSASGMAPTRNQSWVGSASNYLQLMQCWGPDPLADDFAETCQYGGWGTSTGGMSGPDLMARIIGDDTYNRGERNATNVEKGQGTLPFRSVSGEVSEPYTVEYNNAPITYSGLGTFFNANTSNEVPFLPIDIDGHASTAFGVQSAAAAPHLGCGNPASAAAQRCWLVAVPRGVHSGGIEGNPASDCMPTNFGGRPYGAANDQQVGSPVTPDCSFFDDRIVIPLDFLDPSGSCPAGAAERRLVGSDTVTLAISAWQPALCAADGGAAYSLSTNSGNVNRSQLLTGQADMALVSSPVSASSIGLTDPALVEAADVQYGPIVNTGLVFGFVIADGTTQYTDVKLTPRLLAKLLTASYWRDKPFLDADFYSTQSLSRELSVAQTLPEDPEWAALGNPVEFSNMNGQGFVVVGPQGDDAVQALWSYIQADADARAFLAGEPDPWGGVVNPYFLPADHANAVGGGLPVNLATDPIDTFLKADQSITPDKAQAVERFQGNQLDSVAAFPYSTSFTSNASRIFSIDTRTTSTWDPLKPVGALGNGAFIPAPPGSAASQKFIMGPTTAASAARFSLGTASLPLPLAELTSDKTVATARSFARPTPESMQSAAAGASVDAETGFAQIDLATLRDGAYPLTLAVNAAANLASTSLDATARTEYAKLLRYAAADGNTVGTGVGQLPPGFAPLTKAQTAATIRFADALVAPPTLPTNPVTDVALPAPVAGTTGVSVVGASPEAAALTQVQVTQTPVQLTAANTELTSSAAQGALGISLLIGIGGLAAAPFLLRRRRASV
ncbi:hypothetical protein [Cryobacterium sp. N21]|uniref:hypothetical protein n=1 Tax=Cryobacterium sp. N21 TaxID=2048289 RepID=UPI000CE33165|nr:hypothetical protein [Cryobacterium sp. N21]